MDKILDGKITLHANTFSQAIRSFYLYLDEKNIEHSDISTTLYEESNRLYLDYRKCKYANPSLTQGEILSKLVNLDATNISYCTEKMFYSRKTLNQKLLHELKFVLNLNKSEVICSYKLPVPEVKQITMKSLNERLILSPEVMADFLTCDYEYNSKSRKKYKKSNFLFNLSIENKKTYIVINVNCSPIDKNYSATLSIDKITRNNVYCVAEQLIKTHMGLI